MSDQDNDFKVGDLVHEGASLGLYVIKGIRTTVFIGPVDTDNKWVVEKRRLNRATSETILQYKQDRLDAAEYELAQAIAKRDKLVAELDKLNRGLEQLNES
jgi:hypothetical protein